jgi:hypothetical protein
LIKSSVCEGFKYLFRFEFLKIKKKGFINNIAFLLASINRKLRVKMLKELASILLLVSLLQHVACTIKMKKPPLFDPSNFKSIKQSNTIKIVSYALKEETGAIKIAKMPIKNLRINPEENWLAKSLWNGDLYNLTG